MAQFCKGRITKKWRLAQEYYLKTTENARRRSSKSWSTNLINNIYEFIHSQWEHRNSIVTKATKEKASISERNKLANEIRKQFELGCGTLRPKDHHYLEDSVDNILKKNTKSQKYWIRKCTVSREYTENSEKNMLQGMRNIMTAWATVPD